MRQVDDFLSSMMSVLHETGHARYEQHLPLAWRGQPVGLARGTSIHESQSRFFENYVGLSAAEELAENLLKMTADSPYYRFGAVFLKNDGQRSPRSKKAGKLLK